MEGKSLTKRQLLNELNKSKQKISALERKVADGRKYEILLREIHHRVRNNMQIISSLLRLQGKKLKDEDSLEMLRVCQNRIRSMALIHEMLYRSDDLKKIGFAQFIQDLASHLYNSYGVDPGDVKLITKMSEIHLDIDKAVPFALIVNELLANSLRHAFPDGKKGEIQIELRPVSQKKIEFVVSDNGIGFPKDLAVRDVDSLGLRLVNDLVEQLAGKIQLSRENGTSFKIIC